MLRDHFDKLLLTSIFLLIVGVLIWGARSGQMDLVTTAREWGGMVLGGLLGLVTGIKVGMAIADGAK